MLLDLFLIWCVHLAWRQTGIYAALLLYGNVYVRTIVVL